MWSKKRLSPTESTRIRPKPSNPDAFRTTRPPDHPTQTHFGAPTRRTRRKQRNPDAFRTTRPPGDWTTSSAPPPHTETNPTEQVTGAADMTTTRNTRILPSPGLSGSSVPTRPQARPNTLQPALSMTQNPPSRNSGRERRRHPPYQWPGTPPGPPDSATRSASKRPTQRSSSGLDSHFLVPKEATETRATAEAKRMSPLGSLIGAPTLL